MMCHKSYGFNIETLVKRLNPERDNLFVAMHSTQKGYYGTNYSCDYLGSIGHRNESSETLPIRVV